MFCTPKDVYWNVHSSALHNSLNLKATRMHLKCNRVSGVSCSEMLHRSGSELMVATCHNIDEPQNYNMQATNSVTKKYIMYHAVFIEY